MKIIEAMKEQKLIISKLNSNRENIRKYASLLSNERPLIGEEKDQRAEVASLVQSSEDLVARYVWLKTRVDYTNLKTIVTVKDKAYSIAELLILHRNMNEFRSLTLSALNTDAATLRKNKTAAANVSAGMPDVQIIALYDEKKTDQAKRDLMDFHGTITGALEVVNATTDLIEEIL